MSTQFGGTNSASQLAARVFSLLNKIDRACSDPPGNETSLRSMRLFCPHCCLCTSPTLKSPSREPLLAAADHHHLPTAAERLLWRQRPAGQLFSEGHELVQGPARDVPRKGLVRELQERHRERPVLLPLHLLEVSVPWHDPANFLPETRVSDAPLRHEVLVMYPNSCMTAGAIAEQALLRRKRTHSSAPSVTAGA